MKTAWLPRAPVGGWCLSIFISVGICLIPPTTRAATWTDWGLQVAGGRIGSYEWRVIAQPTHRRNEPCVGTQLWRRHTSSASTTPTQTLCGSVTPVPDQLIYSVGSGDSEKAILTIGVDRRATKVRVDMGSRGVRWYRPRVLSQKQAGKLHSVRFGYIASAMAGSVCIHQISTFDKYGAEMWRSVRTRCAE